MKFSWKFLVAVLGIVCAAIAIVLILREEFALILHPKGLIAEKQLKVIHIQILMMLTVIVPTFILIYFIAWKYRASNKKSEHAPNQTQKPIGEVLLWVIPSIVIVVMAFILWDTTHELDPYKPIKNGKEPLTIQVVALDWKWLFIYPEQKIASVNYLQLPVKRPIEFRLAADGSPMNSFWIPQLSGQIYCMTGMVTTLNILANEEGEFSGRAAEINGKGYAGMTFKAIGSSDPDFESWVKKVQESPLHLTEEAYNQLLIPSEEHPVTLYSDVEENLFKKIVMKYM